MVTAGTLVNENGPISSVPVIPTQKHLLYPVFNFEATFGLAIVSTSWSKNLSLIKL